MKQEIHKTTFALIYSVFVVLCSSLVQIAEVKANGEYVPPRREDATTSQGTGSRGCDEQNVSLKLSTPPEGSVAKTVSNRPTFSWYLSVPAEVRFTIVDPEAVEPIFETNLSTKAGVTQLQVPPETELVVGKKYVWTVAVICNHLRPSSNIYARAWIERTPMPPNLERELAEAKNNQERRQIYEAAGIWYDAFNVR